MRSYPQCSSPSSTVPPAPPSSPSSIFSPEFLARLRERDEVPTASAADLAGPWRFEAVPGRPGLVGVLRAWEGLEEGDPLRAVFLQEELAQRCAVALPLLGGEPTFHLRETAGPDGYPLVATDGEQGPQDAARSPSTSLRWLPPSTCSRGSSGRRPRSPR